MSGRIGARVANRRKKLGYTLDQLALMVKTSKSYVWEIENKPTIRPSAMLVWRLSQALEIPYEFLLLGRMPQESREIEALAAFRKIPTTTLKDAAVAMMRGLGESKP